MVLTRLLAATEFVFLNNFQVIFQPSTCDRGSQDVVNLVLCSIQSVIDGGRAGMFWGYVWVIVGQFFIVLSLAEMSSMAPTAGGQYHWVSEFAPRNMQKILSYTSGWLSSLCWQSFVASDCLYAAQLLFSLVSMQNPDFEVKNWYEALTAMLIVILVTAVNTWGVRKLAMLENIFVTLHVAGFVIVLVAVAVTGEKQTAREAFLEFYDGGGYPSVGLAVMVGQVAAMWNVLGQFHPRRCQTFKATHA